MNLEDMPLEEREKRAGEEVVARDVGDSALGIFMVMARWNVDAIIWPENMGTNPKAPRHESL